MPIQQYKQMKKISVYLKLFRLQNLLIIALTMYLVRFCIINPGLQLKNISSQLNELDFFLLVLSIIFVSGAGYIINDYFDIRIDRINNPDKLILGKYIPRQKAILLHTVFTTIAIIIGFYVAYKTGYIFLGFVNVILSAILWFYSIRYKRSFLSGNLLIALLSASVIFIVWLFEFYALKSKFGNVFYFGNIKNFILLYTFFAFIISLAREIIKDIEDIKGDAKVGCKTLPVVLGIKNTKTIVTILTIISFLLLFFVQIKCFQTGYKLLLWYFLIAIQIPFIYLVCKIYKASKKQDYSFLSTLYKIIMLAGILSMLLLYIRF